MSITIPTHIGLGDRVRCIVSGFEGIAMGVDLHFNGCVQVLVRPKVDKDGNPREGKWIDHQQLEVTESAAAAPIGGPKGTGGHERGEYSR